MADKIKPIFENGDMITLNTGYPCDAGKFLRWEDDKAVWEDEFGKVYKSPYTMYDITLKGKKTGRARELFDDKKEPTHLEELIWRAMVDAKYSSQRNNDLNDLYKKFIVYEADIIELIQKEGENVSAKFAIQHEKMLALEQVLDLMKVPTDEEESEKFYDALLKYNSI